MRIAMRIMLVTAAVMEPAPAHATPCIVASPSPGVDLKLQQDVVIHIEGVYLIEKCESFEVVKGKEACVFVGNLLAKKPCIKKGLNARFDMLNDAGAQAKADDGRVMSALLGGAAATRGGLKAQGGEAIAGFPYGDVLVPQGEFVISTKAVLEGPVTSFTIEDKTARKRLAAQIAGNVIRIPGREIVGGHDYSWTAIVAGAPRTGSFSVTTLANEPELAAELATAAKSPELAGNPAALAVSRAIILYDHQFIFDAIRAVDATAPARP